MNSMWRASVVLIVALALVALPGCAGDDESGLDQPSATQNESAETGTGQDQAQAETEVSGRPAEFPNDVPVHPGTVTAYDPMAVTESTTVHQLTVESAASFDDVIAWYETELPAGWSVGFLEQDDESGGREGKIALNGGSYTPASPEGLGGGVIIGVFEGDTTQIVTTVTVMAP
ncbi:MAG: hypothetical protein Q7W51_07745 [Coriobacteriia bacterium]|nr:hypothetical protein [Coriobacteriia bacterium]